MMRDLWRGALVYSLICIGLWPWPVLQILHVESAAVVAATGFFLSGLLELRPLRSGASPLRAIARQVSLLIVPLAMLSLSLLWAPNCAYGTGLVYFAAFAVPSVVLGVSVSALIVASGVKRARSVIILSGLAIAISGVMYDLGLHPQFFTYNHVFGGVLGPIYEEDIRWRPGYGWFRLLTVGWSILCLLGASVLGRRRGVSRRSVVRRRAMVAATAIGMGLIYLNAARLGINTTYQHLEERLGERTVTEHFVIHYASNERSQRRVSFLVDELEHHYAFLRAELDVDVERAIHVYLYPDPFLRGRLTGSRFTSVTPVWLRRPQMHVLVSDTPRTITHELVHVLSREFGLPVVRASPAIALVEGLAVALEAPSGGPSHDDMVLASLTRSGADAEYRLDAIADRLSPLGFWTGRGAVAYSSSGSFVRYLLNAYGPEKLKEVYRSGRFAAVYGRDIDLLVEEWRRRLEQRPLVSAAAGQVSTVRFSSPSLFERRCPHYVAPYRRSYYDAWEALESDDREAALEHIRASLNERGDYVPSVRLALQLLMADGQAAEAFRIVEGVDTLEAGDSFAVLKADVYALNGDVEEASGRYEAVLSRLASFTDGLRTPILMRHSASDLQGMIAGSYNMHADAPFAPASAEDSLAMANMIVSRGNYREAEAWLPSRVHLSDVLLQRYALQLELTIARRSGDDERSLDVARTLAALDRQRGAVDALRYSNYLADMIASRVAARKPDDGAPD